MSQRLYETRNPNDEPVEVLAGWDAALEYLFLVVHRLDEPGGQDEETLYTNLDEENPELKAWEITAVLHKLGLPFPEAWFFRVLKDKRGQEPSGRTHFGRFQYGRHPVPTSRFRQLINNE